MGQNRTFVGKVNDKTYDSIDSYNKALLVALGKEGTITASFELKPMD